MDFQAHAVTAERILLQEFNYGPELCLAVFALLGAAKVKALEKNGSKEIFWAQSIVYTFCIAFGGGILAPFLLGKPPAMFVNDLVVPVVFAAWLVVARCGDIVTSLLGMPVLKQLLVAIAEVFRINGVCSMVDVATNSLTASKYYSIPLFGPVLLGTIAGCGGLFLPLDKGLTALQRGTPWVLQSAFYSALAYHLLTHDPQVTESLGGAYPRQTRAAIVAFMAAVGTVQQSGWPDFNPFQPLHALFYYLSGVPRPGALAAADEKKDKKD